MALIARLRKRLEGHPNEPYDVVSVAYALESLREVFRNKKQANKNGESANKGQNRFTAGPHKAEDLFDDLSISLDDDDDEDDKSPAKGSPTKSVDASPSPDPADDDKPICTKEDLDVVIQMLRNLLSLAYRFNTSAATTMRSTSRMASYSHREGDPARDITAKEITAKEITTESMKAWEIMMSLSGNETCRLLGFLEFVDRIDLCAHATQSKLNGFQRLDQAFRGTSHVNEMIEVVPRVQFLLSVAREAYSVGSITHGRLEPQRCLCTDDLCYGLLVDDQQALLDACLALRVRQGENKMLTWDTISSIGAGYWLYQSGPLDLITEQMARDSYLESCKQLRKGVGDDPFEEEKIEQDLLEELAVWYCVTKKQRVLAELYQKSKVSNISNFLLSDFSLESTRIAALKNAWHLVAQKRYKLALAFFVLGRSVIDAIDVSVRYLADAQLAMLLARLYDRGGFTDKQITPIDFAAFPQNEEVASVQRIHAVSVGEEPREKVVKPRSAVHYLVEAKLSPLAEETQDIALLLFAETLKASKDYPRNVLLFDKGDKKSKNRELIELGQGMMPEGQVATVCQVQESKQPISANGNILGDHVCLRRFSAFSYVPNVLSGFLTGYSLRFVRLDIDLWVSMMRCTFEALARRQMTFAFSLLAFLVTVIPQYNSFIPK